MLQSPDVDPKESDAGTEGPGSDSKEPNMGSKCQMWRQTSQMWAQRSQMWAQSQFFQLKIVGHRTLHTWSTFGPNVLAMSFVGVFESV